MSAHTSHLALVARHDQLGDLARVQWLSGWCEACSWIKQGRSTCLAARLDLERNPRPYARGFVAALRAAGA